MSDYDDESRSDSEKPLDEDIDSKNKLLNKL